MPKEGHSSIFAVVSPVYCVFVFGGFIYLFILCNFILAPSHSLYSSRDGVSESQFNQVLNIELDQIIQVLRDSTIVLSFVPLYEWI